MCKGFVRFAKPQSKNGKKPFHRTIFCRKCHYLLSLLEILAADLRNSRQHKRQHCRQYDLGDHVHSVVDNRIDDGERCTAEGGQHPLTVQLVNSLLGEEPFSPHAIEQRARNDMAQIARKERHNAAKAKCKSLLLYACAEQAAKAENGVGQHVVDQADKDGYGNSHVAVIGWCKQRYDGAVTEQHLQDGIDQCCKGSPFDTEHVGNDDNADHAAKGKRAAE